ncbi:MAG: DnaA regulatory inactivator Hda [Pseudomonadota bacterium]
MAVQIPLAIALDVDSTFDNFYTTKASQACVNFLKEFVSANPGANEKLVYLWGQSGSGVSHLIEAVQHYALSLSIQYLPLQELLHHSPADIFDGLEALDMVCVDDMDCLCGNTQWEQALFHCFNRLRDAGKRILIGAHQSPRQLPLQLSDLQSRLQWGMTFYLPALSEAEQSAVLAFRAQRLGLALPDELIHYVLQRVGRSNRELVDMIKQLNHQSLVEQRKLTIPFVKKVLDL